MNSKLLTKAWWVTTLYKADKEQFVPFGIFGIINYPLSYFMWHNIHQQQYTSLSLRLIACGFCISLIFHKQLPHKVRIWLPVYWKITLIYCISFFGTFMSMKNNFSPGWQMNLVLGLFWLVLLVDWKNFFLLSLIGIISGFVIFKLFGGYLPYNLNQENF